MTPKEIRERSVNELRSLEKQLEEELFSLRFQHRTEQLENTAKLIQVKRDVARVKTILGELERQA